MTDEKGIQRAEYDGLLDKLSAFAATLSPGEQFALAEVLRSGRPMEDRRSDRLSADAWNGLMGVVSTNSADIGNKK